MQTSLSLLIWLAEAEYDGGSFNGPNLVKTLRSLTMEQVTTEETYEGYSVWGIVLHLMYWKHFIARVLGDAALGDFPYQGENWPALPEESSEAAWSRTLSEQDEIHEAYVAALRAFPEGRLGEKMEWGCPFGEAIAWMTTHDTYHIAQIRNMGLKGLVIE